MNRQFLKAFFPRALAWAAVVLLSGVIALAQDANGTASGQRSDGQVEMDVVHALDASNALKKDLITAATIQSEVTLSGTVSSDASKELAESIVMHVPGVSKVHNNLKVGNPEQSDAADPGAPQLADNQPVDSAAPPPQDMEGPTPDPMQTQGQARAQDPNQDQNQAQNPDRTGPPREPRPDYMPGRPPVSAHPQIPVYAEPTGPVTISQGTLLQVRTSEFLDSKRAKDGTQVQFTVIHDVVEGGVLAIPRGATVHGVVTETKNAGTLGGSSELALKLTSLDLGGQNYPLESDAFKVKSPNKAGYTAGNIFGGAVLGAIIGGAVGGGSGAAIGAAAGGGAGTAASAATPGPRVWIPAEALMSFHLAGPITVSPVSHQEAMRLAQGLYPGGPTLYRRPGYYPYPPPYYRPYYVTGGYYYWR